MSKSSIFSAWITKAQVIADSLNVPLVVEGLRASDSSPYSPSPNEDFVLLNFLWGEENRPYLDGDDGQTCTSIVQLDFKAAKGNPFKAISGAEVIASSIGLNESVGGAYIFNKTIAQVIRDETHSYHPVSVTIKDVNLP